MLGIGKSSKDGDATVTNGKKAWEKLCAALVQMSQPVDIPVLSPKLSAESQEYYDFLARNNDRNTETVREYFMHIAVTRVCSTGFSFTID